MKQLVLLLTLGCLLACSKKDKEEDPCRNELLFTYSHNRNVDTIRTSGVLDLQSKAGDKIVFSYTNSYNCLSVQDEEYVEELLFEVPPNVNSFSYTNGALVDANAWYIVKCYCPGVGARRITKGTITGEKTGGRWEVKIDVEGPVFAAAKTIKLTKTFTQQ